jgi:hypothetical protein
MTITQIQSLRARGISFVAVGGSLHVSPATRLTSDDRAYIHDHAAEILKQLSNPPVDSIPTRITGNSPWDTRIALQLMADADALVEQLGVNGRHPAITDAAAMVASANATRDMETLRFSVAEFTVVVRSVARGRYPNKAIVGAIDEDKKGAG